MSNIQKTLDSLQPYVIGIRYVEGTPLVDVVFKEGWTVPDEPKIKKVQGNEEMNYYMIYSDITGIGLDELLAFVEKTIKLNIEREKKHDLLRLKVNELKEVFKKNSLNKLKTLKFAFSEEDLIPKLDDFDVDLNEDIDLFQSPIPGSLTQHPGSIQYEEEIIESPDNMVPIGQGIYLDEKGQPIQPTEEELELMAEEARAKRNLEYLENKNSPKKRTPASKIELPPKKIEIPEINIDYSNSECDCGPNVSCNKCIDTKYQ